MIPGGGLALTPPTPKKISLDPSTPKIFGRAHVWFKVTKIIITAMLNWKNYNSLSGTSFIDTKIILKNLVADGLS